LRKNTGTKALLGGGLEETLRLLAVRCRHKAEAEIAVS
jgi:hypothetical protein